MESSIRKTPSEGLVYSVRVTALLKSGIWFHSKFSLILPASRHLAEIPLIAVAGVVGAGVEEPLLFVAVVAEAIDRGAVAQVAIALVARHVAGNRELSLTPKSTEPLPGTRSLGTAC